MTKTTHLRARAQDIGRFLYSREVQIITLLTDDPESALLTDAGAQTYHALVLPAEVTVQELTHRDADDQLDGWVLFSSSVRFTTWGDGDLVMEALVGDLEREVGKVIRERDEGEGNKGFSVDKAHLRRVKRIGRKVSQLGKAGGNGGAETQPALASVSPDNDAPPPPSPIFQLAPEVPRQPAPPPCAVSASSCSGIPVQPYGGGIFGASTATTPSQPLVMEKAKPPATTYSAARNRIMIDLLADRSIHTKKEKETLSPTHAGFYATAAECPNYNPTLGQLLTDDSDTDLDGSGVMTPMMSRGTITPRTEEVTRRIVKEEVSVAVRGLLQRLLEQVS